MIARRVVVELDRERFLVPCQGCGRTGAIWQITEWSRGQPVVRYVCSACGAREGI